jgi:uncharacterized protein YjdB
LKGLWKKAALGLFTVLMCVWWALPAYGEPITFESGAIPNDYYEVAIGEKVDLGKNDNEDEFVKYESSDDTVAAVDDYGVVEAVKEGTAIVTRKGRSGTTTYLMKVVKANQTKLSVSGVLYTQEKKEASNYVITLLKDDNALQQITDGKGEFQFSDLETGEYLILVQDGQQDNITASGRISLLNADFLELQLSGGSISAKYSREIKMQHIDLSEKETELFEGEKLQLGWTLTPTNVTDPTLRFYSSDTSVATVDENGRIVAVKKGSALITAASTDGTVVDSCMVTVKSSLGNKIVISVELGLIFLIILGFFFLSRHANKKYKQKVSLDEEQ